MERNVEAEDSGVIYSSGVVIRDEDYLSTLTVLYSRVYLANLDNPILSSFVDNSEGPREPDERFVEKAVHAVIGWEEKHNLLLSEGVLARLDASPMSVEQSVREEDFEHVFATLLHQKTHEIKKDAGAATDWAYLISLLFHLVRKDVSLPRIFLVQSTRLSRESLVALEAFHAFRYLLPKLGALHDEQILELRRRLKDIREGFTMHLQKLSKGLDGMVKAGEKLHDLKGYAQNIVESDLIPDYREFRRQLEAEQAGKIKKVLDVTGKIMEIDAAPWTPKFWGLLLKALGMSAIETAADQKERLTNRYQAYEFMKTVEDVGQGKR